jgi:hypothetical protein
MHFPAGASPTVPQLGSWMDRHITRAYNLGRTYGTTVQDGGRSV